jgi:hypothetical protein
MQQQQLLRAQQRMKLQVDKHHFECEFQVGDLVYLKVQLLPHDFFGPYKVLQRVGTAACKLDLPTHARIHNVVHVSQLKKHVLPNASKSSDIAAIQPNTILIPAGCLQHWLIQKGIQCRGKCWFVGRGFHHHWQHGSHTKNYAVFIHLQRLGGKPLLKRGGGVMSCVPPPVFCICLPWAGWPCNQTRPWAV